MSQFQTVVVNSSSDQLIALIKKEEFSVSEKKKLLFELAFMLLRLFNKACVRFYTGLVYDSVTKAVSISDMDSFEYTYEFVEGLRIRREILKLFNNFYVFPGNSLITDRDTYNKNPRVLYLEETIKTSHMSGEVMKMV